MASCSECPACHGVGLICPRPCKRLDAMGECDQYDDDCPNPLDCERCGGSGVLRKRAARRSE